MTMRTISTLVVAVAAGAITAFNVFAQGEQSILPIGFERHTLSSGWQKGGHNRSVCAGLVTKRFPNKPFQIDHMWEEQKFRNKILKTDSRYKYHCTVTVDLR